MKTLIRPVRFEEVDAARIVFFGRYFSYAHEAMENFFSDVEGGYRALICEREVGFPAVHIETEYLAPLRYGDVITIQTRTERLGGRSAILGYDFFRQDGVLVTKIKHTVVVSCLRELRSIEMPADVRQVFTEHLAPPAA